MTVVVRVAVGGTAVLVDVREGVRVAVLIGVLVGRVIEVRVGVGVEVPLPPNV